MNQLNPAISLKHVSKIYSLHGGKPSLSNALTGHKPKKFAALKDINLTIYSGERYGIVGNNGSGKSTLLKIIAGVVQPSLGKVTTSGKILSLISLTSGFNKTLSGKENIYLQMALHNATPTQIKDSLEVIISYAGIGQYINEPVHTYSSGMLLRLGYAIIMHLQADIYLFDEFLSVGDTEFQSRTRLSLEKLKQSHKTIIIANQNFGNLLHFCSHVVTIEKGQIPPQPALTRPILEFYKKVMTTKTSTVEVISNSMFPQIKKGDTISFNHQSFASIEVGDIIVFCFSNFPQLIAHRVFGIVDTLQGKAFLTKGDANNQFDNWLVAHKEYIGRVTSHK